MLIDRTSVSLFAILIAVHRYAHARFSRHSHGCFCWSMFEIGDTFDQLAAVWVSNFWKICKLVLTISAENSVSHDGRSWLRRSTVFCPGLEKGTVLPEGKGHGVAWGKKALSHAESHFEGTFACGITFWGHFRAQNSHKRKRGGKELSFYGFNMVTTFLDKIEFQL